jgi:cadmium resistance protein CadD (predicted permease)
MWASGIYIMFGATNVTYYMVLFLLFTPQGVPRKQFSAVSGGGYCFSISVIADIQWDVCY